MKKCPEVQRWSDHAGQANVAERAAGNTVRHLPPPQKLSPVAYARIWAKVQADCPRTRPRWTVVLAAGVLSITAVASAARLDLLPAFWRTRNERKGDTATVSRKPDRHHVAGAMKNQPIGAAEGKSRAGGSPGEKPPSTTGAAKTQPGYAASERATVSPLQNQDQPRLSARERRPLLSARSAEHQFAVPVAPTLQSSPPVTASWSSSRLTPPLQIATPPRNNSVQSPMTPEIGDSGSQVRPMEAPEVPGHVLASALHALRVRHSPDACLQLLDRHEQRIAAAGLAYEALILRVEALIALGRSQEAMRLLDGDALSDSAAPRRLLVLRGSLRATAGRCSEGLQDFDRVLAGGGRPDRQALLGRALCRAKVGDQAGARADRQRYEQLFPPDGKVR
jgi:hypothetical protein